jgi:hypothetical protein
MDVGSQKLFDCRFKEDKQLSIILVFLGFYTKIL